MLISWPSPMPLSIYTRVHIHTHTYTQTTHTRTHRHTTHSPSMSGSRPFFFLFITMLAFVHFPSSRIHSFSHQIYAHHHYNLDQYFSQWGPWVICIWNIQNKCYKWAFLNSTEDRSSESSSLSGGILWTRIFKKQTKWFLGPLTFTNHWCRP